MSAEPLSDETLAYMQETAYTALIPPRWVDELVAEVRALRAGALRESVSPRPQIAKADDARWNAASDAIRKAFCGDYRTIRSHTYPTAVARVALDAADAVGVSPPPSNENAQKLRDWLVLVRPLLTADMLPDDLTALDADLQSFDEESGVGVSPPSPDAQKLADALRALVDADTKFFADEEEGDYPELHNARSVLDDFAARARVSVPQPGNEMASASNTQKMNDPYAAAPTPPNTPAEPK